MVFVHSRKDTVKTAEALHQISVDRGQSSLFEASVAISPHTQDAVLKSRNREMRDLFPRGFAIHHAGMLRGDRNLTEKLFAEGLVKVLVCTATLAWGVNLPAHAVIIKGTQVYDVKTGSFVDLGFLDVLQIFGRAGRPQFETHGEAVLITTHDRLTHYVGSLVSRLPIESQSVAHLVDNLNAEITLGTVTSVTEAIQWLAYTYLYVRMRKNPLHYGINHAELMKDTALVQRRTALIDTAAKRLVACRMIRYDERVGTLTGTDLGRVASQYYIRHTTIELFLGVFEKRRSAADGSVRMTEADVLAMVSMSTEFENLKLRDDEEGELSRLMQEVCCCAVKGGIDTTYGKVNILLQAYIAGAQVYDSSLTSEMAYVAQNAARIVRALFELVLRRGWATVTGIVLSLAKSIDRRMWPFEHPLGQLDMVNTDLCSRLNSADQRLNNIEFMREMGANELGSTIHFERMGRTLYDAAWQFPVLHVEAVAQPITRTIVRLFVHITPDFQWTPRLHGSAQHWWIWIEDAETDDLHHSSPWTLTRTMIGNKQTLCFTVPVRFPPPPQYIIRVVSDHWIRAEATATVSFRTMNLPESEAGFTPLLDLPPLPLTALNHPQLQTIYGKTIGHFFNPVQTQVFHTLYCTTESVLLGAPTGSGKTLAAELAMWHAFRTRPNTKVVYIAPLKALVKGRLADWQRKWADSMGLRIIELTGDATPDLPTLKRADVIITTPEKWDGITRFWSQRSYVQLVSLLIIDEIHLVGADRGPTLEVIVSRLNYISAKTSQRVRIVGLSTALANPHDLGRWLGISDRHIYNFSNAVRIVPLETHIAGFPGKHYCPRMATMNKPAFTAIQTYSPDKPVLIFVSSRRQTRLTAQGLTNLCAVASKPTAFLHVDDEEQYQALLANVQDTSLKESLAYGIGLHHAGLGERDRRLVEELFTNRKIQVLIATSTLAWRVNLPAHLVIVKGAEYFDAKTKGYLDFPITDVLQMIGRAGRPGMDTSGTACIFVKEEMLDYYKKFLYEAFPVESSLHLQLTNHLNAEIAAGQIGNKKDAVQYLTWTYLFRRLIMNPSFYGLDDADASTVNAYMSGLVDASLGELVEAQCITVKDHDHSSADFLDNIGEIVIEPTPLGKTTAMYYLEWRTARLFASNLPLCNNISDVVPIVQVLCDAAEFDEVPVRHNEEIFNAQLSRELSVPRRSASQINLAAPTFGAMEDPHTKARILIQAHLDRLRMPIVDYVTDTKSVLDQGTALYL